MQGASANSRNRLRTLLERASNGSDRRFFFAVFIPVAIVYLATTSWGVDVNIDVMTNTFTAWSLGTTGSPIVQGYDVPDTHRNYITWLVPTDGGDIVSYPPGAPLLAAPFYAIGGRGLNDGLLSRDAEEVAHLDPIPLRYPDVWPGSVAAALASAAAIGFLGLTFRVLTDGPSALVGSYVAALGTSVWSVAADALWQHGPSLMWIALGVYLTHRQRWWGAGLAFGAAVLTRQLDGVIAASIGIGIALQLRSVRPLLRVGVASSIGLAAISLWNWVFLGTAAPWGSRGGEVSGMVTIAPGRASFSGDVGTDIGLLENQLRGAFDRYNGFMLLTPLFFVAVFFLAKAWRDAPPATRAAAIGGLAYYLVQHRFQIYAHLGYDGYRYPLEALMASAPLWLLAYRRALEWSRLVPPGSALASIAIHALKAVRS